jgi:hypothetical protein
MSISFLEQMKEIPDHRITGMVIYPLDEILLATLVGGLCGADDGEAIETRKTRNAIVTGSTSGFGSCHCPRARQGRRQRDDQRHGRCCGDRSRAGGHCLAGLTKTAVLELATFCVTVNCVSPDYVWTPLVEKQVPDTMAARNMTREQVIHDVILLDNPIDWTDQKKVSLALEGGRKGARKNLAKF